MTPKEKAEQLTQQFMDIKHVKLSDYSRIEWPTARRCATIVIDELIRIAPWGGNPDAQEEDGSKEFYINVKQEIENL